MTKVEANFMKLYGLKACDTCRKARQDIEKSGRTLEFVDVRDTPLGPEKIARFAKILGERLLNKRSTTWREIPENEQSEPIEVLIARYPTVMKRPVIENGEILTLGWDATAKAEHLGNS